MREGNMKLSWREVRGLKSLIAVRCEVYLLSVSQVGIAAATVDAQYASYVEPFKCDSIAAGVQDFAEACAMGWKPERSLEAEWTAWLQATVDTTASDEPVSLVSH